MQVSWKSWVAGTCLVAAWTVAVGADRDVGVASFGEPLPLSILASPFTYGDILSATADGMVSEVRRAVASGRCAEVSSDCPIEALAKTAALIDLCSAVSIEAWDESSVADLETWNAGRDRDAVVHGVCQEQAPALESLAPLGGRFVRGATIRRASFA